MKRRDFLKAGCAAVGALTVGGAAVQKTMPSGGIVPPRRYVVGEMPTEIFLPRTMSAEQARLAGGFMCRPDYMREIYADFLRCAPVDRTKSSI